LENVDFAYADDNEPVLSDVNLDLEPGETLGLVGRTGSGKTTIARLVLRLYDPTSGSVRLGGVDAREAGTASIRSRLAVVTQDVQLFAASVRDNVTLFGTLGDGDDSRIAAALQQVGLAAWLDQLPDGLDTMLGPQGGGVSAGEAQLLAFGRTFLTDPGIVVLDEASSRLDPATENVIENAIGNLLSGRTAVLIAHRLSSLRRVDKIAVVDDGRKLLSNVVHSQIDIHKAYGGVVPEVAARNHLETMMITVVDSLSRANKNWDDIDAIAVTYAPGLIGSLLVGTLTARTLAIMHDKPLYPIHHVEGHVYANFLLDEPPRFPMLALIVSGGHTQLVWFEDHGKYRLLGQTQDDAVGEAFLLADAHAEARGKCA
jgi:ABC-type multidrug transport system ATPase subunit